MVTWRRRADDVTADGFTFRVIDTGCFADRRRFGVWIEESGCWWERCRVCVVLDGFGGAGGDER